MHFQGWALAFISLFASVLAISLDLDVCEQHGGRIVELVVVTQVLQFEVNINTYIEQNTVINIGGITIDITNAPTTLTTEVTATTTTTVTSSVTVTQTTSNSGPTVFLLSPQPITANRKQRRQDLTFLDATGKLHRGCAQAATFSITAGELFSGGLQVSTNEEVSSQPFGVSSVVGSITTLFSATDKLIWSSGSFFGNEAQFCATDSQIFALFLADAAVEDCVLSNLIAVPVSICNDDEPVTSDIESETATPSSDLVTPTSDASQETTATAEATTTQESTIEPQETSFVFESTVEPEESSSTLAEEFSSTAIAEATCATAITPASTPVAIGDALLANGPVLTPQSVSPSSSFFSFQNQVALGSLAGTYGSPPQDAFGFYKISNAVLPATPACTFFGYLYHVPSGLCVTVDQTASTRPRYNSANFALRACDACTDVPPDNQLFCFYEPERNSYLPNQCIVFFGDADEIGATDVYTLNNGAVFPATTTGGECIYVPGFGNVA